MAPPPPADDDDDDDESDDDEDMPQLQEAPAPSRSAQELGFDQLKDMFGMELDDETLRRVLRRSNHSFDRAMEVRKEGRKEGRKEEIEGISPED